MEPDSLETRVLRHTEPAGSTLHLYQDPPMLDLDRKNLKVDLCRIIHSLAVKQTESTAVQWATNKNTIECATRERCVFMGTGIGHSNDCPLDIGK